MDHGSWINAAPRQDKELPSLSGVTYMLCLKQPQGIRGSSGASLFLNVTLYKKKPKKPKQGKDDQSDKGFPWRHANQWCLVPKTAFPGTLVKAAWHKPGCGGILISWHQNTQIRGKNWR